MNALSRFILWDYPRASLPYDIMVGLIVLFIFATPRDFFRDQPKPTSVVMIPAQHGVNAYWLEPELLSGVPESERLARATALVRARFRNRHKIERLEPILDSEQELRGWVAFPAP